MFALYLGSLFGRKTPFYDGDMCMRKTAKTTCFVLLITSLLYTAIWARLHFLVDESSNYICAKWLPCSSSLDSARASGKCA